MNFTISNNINALKILNILINKKEKTVSIEFYIIF